MMTPEQISIVQNTWNEVDEIHGAVASLFYGRLFEIDPALKSLFNNDMEAQGNKLMLFLTMVVSALDKIDTLVPVIEDMGRRHGRYGVKVNDYQSVGAALLWTLEKHFGAAFNTEVKEAWTAAFTLLASVMIAAQGGV